MTENKADLVFECSWEVCNKVGGIYTVVRSKAAKMVETYGDNYFLVGPYFASQASGQFSEEVPIDQCKHAFEELKKIGIMCHFGRWLIEGNPYVILIDFANYRGRINEIKTNLWEWYKIDSLKAPYDYDEPVSWAYVVGIMIEQLLKSFGGKKCVAHFHEWLSGAGLLYLKRKNTNAGCVFTTHATILGRTLASSNVDLYNVWDKINPDEEAYRYGIESKHLLEKACAQAADVFTTVSEITGMEASHFLKRKPDVLLLNGLDISKFPSIEEVVFKHRLQRDRVREFMIYYFFPYYTFDLNESLIFFIAGRNEFHDKGIDIYIKSLGNLNETLKKEKSKKTIVAFVWVPGNIRGIKQEILENKTLYLDIKDALEDEKDAVVQNILYSFASSKKISENYLFDEQFLTEMRVKTGKFRKKGKPPILTHDLYDENETIVNAIRAAGLTNDEKDRVKVIYYPIYLSGADGILNLNYYESMQASHLGVFPSYYEPWGYTPLEAGALGVSSVTTDLAGFGRYFCSDCDVSELKGIYVLKRLNKTYDDVVNQLTDVMHKFSLMTKEERIAGKLKARQIASTADWKSFIHHYIEAHNLAVANLRL